MPQPNPNDAGERKPASQVTPDPADTADLSRTDSSADPNRTAAHVQALQVSDDVTGGGTASSTFPLLPGYRIESELGKGGMGVVLQAVDERLGRRVALKLMVAELAHNPLSKARFLREAKAAAAVEHENVVPILHVGEERGTPFIVMPLLKGETLFERLQRVKRLTPEAVILLGKEVAAGLAAAHAQGLIHRDIKPGNIWLDAGTDRARILDFGLARPEGNERELSSPEITQPGGVVGTPAYMAPEQAAAQPLDGRADLFSLGCVLYHASTGTRPFGGGTVMATLSALATVTPPPPHAVNPDVPPALSSVIVDLLAKDPAERLARAFDVIERLSTDSPPPAHKGTSRRRSIITAVLSTVLVVSAVIRASMPPSSRTVETPPKEETRDTFPPAQPIDTRDKLGAYVARAVFSESTTSAQARVTFSKPINSNSLYTPNAIQLSGPNKGSIPFLSVNPVGGVSDEFDVAFDSLPSGKGEYMIRIGVEVIDKDGNQLNQNKNAINGEIPEDEFVGVGQLQGGVSPDAGGASITAAVFSGKVQGSFDQIALTFNKAINATTFSPADIASLTDPAGKAIVPRVVSVVPESANTRFIVEFDKQNAAGQYSVTLGVDILDATGNQMNQNRNTVNGEFGIAPNGDMFTTTQTLTSK